MLNEDKAIVIKMYVPDEALTGTYDVIKVDEHLYQLINNDPFYEELSYGTIIEVYSERRKDGAFEFKKVYKESSYTLVILGLPSELNETELRVVGDKIINIGGFWEVLFGGLAYVNIPKNSKFNVFDELNKLIKAKHIK